LFVLIGDANQLPSVDYGNVLKDLLKYQEVPRTILTQCVRQAGILKENALKILEGKIEPSVEKIWYKITKYTKAEDIYTYIGQMYKTSIKEKDRFSLVSRLRSANHAWRGLGILFKTTHNVWVHLFFR
jgi:ATP-dependent exoDNAse (exonuclease V) alpha subunit